MSELKKATKGVSIILIGMLAGKLFSLVRQQMQGYYFGAGKSVDAYNMAFKTSTVVFGFFVFAISTTFIPIFNSIIAKKGKEEAFDMANNVTNIMSAVCIIIMLIAAVFVHPVTQFISQGYHGQKLELTIELTLIMIPTVFISMITSLHTAILQSLDNFAIPSLLLVPYNIVIVIILIVGKGKFGIYAYAFGTLIGYIAQMIMQIPPLMKLGFRFKPIFNFNDHYIKTLLITAVPVIIGSSVQQINTMVDSSVGTRMGNGAVSSLNYANILSCLLQGIFVLAVTKVIFPSMSRVIEEGDLKRFKGIFVTATNITTLVSMPFMIILLAMNNNIVRVVFERGAFNKHATAMTSYALFFYAFGLVAGCLREIVLRTYYSLKDTKTPMINGIIGVVLNITLILLFTMVLKLGYIGLALAASISANVVYFMLLFNLKRKINDCGAGKVITTIAKSLVAGIVMAVICKVSMHFIGSFHIHFHSKLLTEAINITVVSILGLIGYVATCALVKIEEISYIFDFTGKLIKKHLRFQQ